MRAENGNIVIIFITNFIQYAPEGFEVQAFRYLLKADLSIKLPSYFDSAVQEVLRRKQLVTISINSEIIDVPVNDILYLESIEGPLLCTYWTRIVKHTNSMVT